MANSNILIAFYSQTGNTKRIAELIQKHAGGELKEVMAETPYKSLYLGGAERVKSERSRQIHPPIMPLELNENEYACIFLGTPNWGNGIAHPMMTFLDTYKFAGKTIYPFCTHGGGGLAHIAGDIEKHCPQASIGKSFDTYGDGGANAELAIRNWLQSINVGR